MDKTKACKVCGSTERYRPTNRFPLGRCIPCTKAHNKKAYKGYDPEANKKKYLKRKLTKLAQKRQQLLDLPYNDEELLPTQLKVEVLSTIQPKVEERPSLYIERSKATSKPDPCISSMNKDDLRGYFN